jgi:hypothetical protein
LLRLWGRVLIWFNGLIEVMKSTLRAGAAIKGEVVMSSELEKMYNCFVFHKVPAAWEEAGYPCLKPLPSWVEDFMLRICFMSDWLHGAPAGLLAVWFLLPPRLHDGTTRDSGSLPSSSSGDRTARLP